MSSRYPPSSGFNPRDRSPQRFGDRRPPSGPRGADDPNLPIGREPPRAPKALIDTPRGAPFAGRGRGYPGRGDFRDRDRDPRDRDRERDRDFRDIRDGPPPFRRDIDRDWGRRSHDFDPREPRIGFGRGRSRSPPPPRDFRDMREPIGRDPDMVRMRRGSRDSLMSVSSAVPDGPPTGTGHHPRGGPIRGRGRGDWEGGRGRGRVLYLDDRDSFRRRSRSRDGRWERDRDRDRERERDRERVIERDRDRERMLVDRDRDRDLDRRDRERDRDLERRDRFDRRDELDRRVERDDRDRPVDAWKRDRPPSRNESRIPSNSTTPSAATSVHTGPPPPEKLPDHPPNVELPRKLSGGDSWRDVERPEPLQPRQDPPKDFLAPVVKRSPPPAAPQVPAFGSVTAPIPDLSVEKPSIDTAPPPAPATKTEKERNELPTRPQMQPPTGPKADRAAPQHSLDQRIRHDEPKRDEIADTSVKPESTARAPKPQTVAASSGPTKLAELSPPAAPAAMVSKEPAITTPDSSPSKLGSAQSVPEVGRGPSSTRRSASPSLHTSPRMHSANIPTGPRALQQRPATSRGPAKPNKQWVRPGYSRPQPGTSPPAAPKRDSIDEQDRRLSLNEDGKREAQKLFDDQPAGSERGDEMDTSKDAVSLHEKDNAPTFKPPADVTDGAISPPRPVVDETPVKSTGGPNSVIIPDFGRSSDEDEDENVFTQEYLEERKRIFEKDIKALRAEMPPPPLEDPSIVALLMRIQLLGMIANDVVPENAQASPPPPPTNEAVSTEKPTITPLVEPSVPEKKTEDHEPPTKLVLDSLPDAAENLPFLHSGPPTPISDLDVYQENANAFDSIRDIFRGELIDRRKAIAKKNAELRMDFLSYYKHWRFNVWELDRLKEKEKTSITPGPTPPPAPSVTVTPTPIPEGRRYKGNSELDFQNALRASEISAQEELERRRENKATAQPDLTREAVIPDMLDPREAKARIYKDTNNIVDQSQAMEVFGFLPPPNDFTPEEHVIFTDAFMTHPKKWGKIAESLPGRDFKQCIVHYYLTKEEIKYKAKLNKRWSRRGRARRSARPKSNALMVDLGVVKPDYEGEEEPTPVTDTGRPRRAAAPIFGDSSADTEQSANGRRGHASKDGEQSEKPTGRRGPRSGTGTRGGRRGKAAAQQQQQRQQQQQQQQQQQAPSTLQQEQPSQAGAAAAVVATTAALASTLAFVPVPKSEVLEPSFDGTVDAGPPRLKEQADRDQVEIPPRAKSGRGRQRDGMYVFESTEQESTTAPTPAATTRQQETNYGSLQPTSYWSVPEQRDFPLLLAHFGRSFADISNYMKTKTAVMVKNYFQRQVDSGKTDFEEIVAEAEAKKARGEATGQLPMSNFAAKRRYEATPSSIVPRPIAPLTEVTPEIDDGRLAPKTKHTGPSPQPALLHARPLQEKERGTSRYPPLAQASAAAVASHTPATTALSEEVSRGMPTQTGLPQRLQGPRRGFFADDRRDISATVLSHAASRPQEAPISARQTILSGPEMTRIESVHGQGFRPSNLDMHGSALLPGQNSMAPSQQQYVPRGQSQAQPPPSLMSAASHSRQSSLTKPPGSPLQQMPRHESEISPIRRDSLSQRPFYPLPGQHLDISQPPSVLSPSKESTRPIELSEPPRQVPAKRSNIMSILNDEPEEPQPRKRFASDQTSSGPAPTVVSPSRPAYAGVSSLTQPALSRQEEAKGSIYAQQSQYLPTSRVYSDYPSYGSAPGNSSSVANNDWMARFDPRGQQQPQLPSVPPPPPPPPNARPPAALGPPQPPYSPYASGQSLSGPTLPNLAAPSPAPTLSPVPSQRHSYPTSVYAPSPAPHAPPPGSGPRDPRDPRDLPPQAPMFRSSIGSPPPRTSTLGYGSHAGAPTPIQSSAQRQQPPVSSYASTAPTTPASGHVASGSQQQHHAGPQGYQHVPAMVSGVHHPQPHRTSLGLSGAQYGHNTPPPHSQGSRIGSLAGPGSQQMSIGRSYTPPAILQPNPTGGLSYAPSGPPHPLQTRPPVPGSLGEAMVPGPHGGPSHHHRVYSQGSNPGPSGPQNPPR